MLTIYYSTVDEIIDSFKGIEKNKLPGPDDLFKEFFLKFIDIFCENTLPD